MLQTLKIRKEVIMEELKTDEIKEKKKNRENWEFGISYNESE